MTDEAQDFSTEAQDRAQIEEWRALPLYMKVLHCFAGFMMFVLVMFVFVDVVGRYGFSAPVFGGLDLVEFIMGILVFSAIPLISRNNDHITVSLLDHFFRGKIRRIQQTWVLVGSTIIAGFVAFRMFVIGEVFS